MAARIKIVGNSGRISLGKQYAGRHVLVDELEPGVWIVKIGEFIPENKREMQESAPSSNDDAGLLHPDHDSAYR